MAEPSNTLRQILERIRDDTQQALKLLGNAAEFRSLGWKCQACGHVKIEFELPRTLAPPAPPQKQAESRFHVRLNIYRQAALSTEKRSYRCRTPASEDNRKSLRVDEAGVKTPGTYPVLKNH